MKSKNDAGRDTAGAMQKTAAGQLASGATLFPVITREFDTEEPMIYWGR